LQAMNEELRSAAEELETSKEELQSINEELRTVNQELKIKIEETTLGNNNLQNLINSVGVITIFLDRNFSVVFFTPAARSVFSLLPTDYGRPLSDITSQLSQQNLLKDAASVLSNLHIIEKEMTSTDGRVFLMRILPYRTAEDHINGVVITLFDITARKIAEEKLRTSEARFRNIVTHTSAGISEMDFDGKFIYTNERLRDILGYSSAEMKDGMKIQDITFADDVAVLKTQFDKCVSEGIPFVGEKRYVRKNGAVVWVLDSISLIRNSEGQPRNLINVTLDIHERKLSEEALSHAEERFKHLSESGLLSIAFFTSDGIATESNDSFLNLTGYTRKQMEAGEIRLDVLTPPEWTFRTHAALEELKETGRVMPYEKESFRRDGSRFWGLWGGSAYPEKHGNISFVLNVTGIKALEKQKDVFIGIASHELKTPVTSIKAYAELLKEMLENAPDKEPYQLASRLDGQVSRLTKLIHSLLDTTKIAEGHLVLQTGEFELNELIREQAEEMQRIAPQHPLELNLAELQTIIGDRERIGQVITNIVANAIKYSDDNKHIVITTVNAGEYASVSIRDFGIGVPESARGKIFDRFYREHNKQIDAIPGIGLGLYIAAEIIKQHGGEIGVENPQGGGALFYFKLPYHGK
jgi:two-component system CheB/CheR fusion protein